MPPPATEKLLQEGINTLMKGRTSFIIAHRLSTIKSCSRIMYVAPGQDSWRKAGTHEELMEKKGHYYNLYMAQYDLHPQEIKESVI